MTLDNHCIQGLRNVPPTLQGGVLTIGNFDGVHVGHRRILGCCRELADELGAPVVAMTFEPPPDLVLRPNDVPQRLTPPEPKAQLLVQAGADRVVFVTADDALLSQTPEEFLDAVILRRFAPRHIVEGRDFCFGCRRQGNLATLRDAGRHAGFEVHTVDPVAMELDGRPQRVSSSLIRGLISAGRVEDAARCLGRPFTLYGRVVAGAGQGRLLRFPTANLEVDGQIVPPDGVYAGRAAVGDRVHPAAISIGNKPTFGPSPRTIEAFLLDVSADAANRELNLYDRRLALEFVRRLRDQERFDGLDALRAQIERDVQRVREICG